MGLYKRKKSNFYWISYTFNGKRYFKSTNTEDIKVARKIEKVLQAKIALDQWHPEQDEEQPSQ